MYSMYESVPMAIFHFYIFPTRNWKRKWQPTPVFLPGESQGWGSLAGYCLWGRRVGHDWSDLAAAAASISEPTEVKAMLLSHNWPTCSVSSHWQCPQREFIAAVFHPVPTEHLLPSRLWTRGWAGAAGECKNGADETPKVIQEACVLALRGHV